MPVIRIKDGQAEFGRPHLYTPAAQMKTQRPGGGQFLDNAIPAGELQGHE